MFNDQYSDRFTQNEHRKARRANREAQARLRAARSELVMRDALEALAELGWGQSAAIRHIHQEA